MILTDPVNQTPAPEPVSYAAVVGLLDDRRFLSCPQRERADEQTAQIAGSRMTAFSILLVGYTLSQFYRSCLAIIAPELTRELGLSAADLGNISAAWFVAFALAQFAVGWGLDRVGPRRTISALMISAAIGAASFSTAQSSTGAIVSMALIGVGCSPIYVGALYLFSRTQPIERFALLSSWLLGLGSLGNLLGTTPLAMAAETCGWRPLFAGLGAVTLLAALSIAWLTPDTPLRAAELGTGRKFILDLKEVLHLRVLWTFWPLMTFSYGLVAAERGLWVGPLLSDVYGSDPLMIGNVALAMALAMSIGALTYGPLEHWLGRSKCLAFSGNTIAGLGFAALGLVPTNLTIVTLVLCIIGCAGLNWGMLVAHARQVLPRHLFGLGLAFANFLCMSGAGLIQTLSGSFVEVQTRAGLPAASVYAALHSGFAIVLLSATAIYVFSSESR